MKGRRVRKGGREGGERGERGRREGGEKETEGRERGSRFTYFYRMEKRGCA